MIFQLKDFFILYSKNMLTTKNYAEDKVNKEAPNRVILSITMHILKKDCVV